MVSDILHSSSVKRLQNLLGERYGKSLLIRFLDDVTTLDAQSQQARLRGSDLVIPILSRGEFLATAIIPHADELPKMEYPNISELVRLILEPVLNRWRLIHNSGPKNVGSFQREFYVGTSFVLMESHNPYAIQKMASQVHEITSGWAQIQYNDIKAQIRSEYDFKDLGPMTIFIDDILKLSPEEQELLARYRLIADPNQDPLILVGCTTPMHELIAREMIDHDWGLELLRNQIQIDMLPAQSALLMETLELILDRRNLLN